MVLVLTTGEENAGQELEVPVPGRASPLRTRPVDSGSVALFPPLSTVLFLDAGTSAPVAEQNGSIALPYALAQDAITVAGTAKTIMIAPGDYGVGLTVDSVGLTFVGMGDRGTTGPILFSGISFTSASGWFENMGVAFEADDSDVHFLNCQLGGNCTNGASVFATNSQFTGTVDGASSILATGCDVNIITDCGDALLTDCDISGDITCTGTLTIRKVGTVQAGLTLTATSIVVDSETLRALVFAGTTFVGPVSGYTGQVLQWGAAAATPGQFLNPGNRALNATSNAGEDFTRIFAGRAGVLCLLHGYSNGALTITVRLNTADTALTITCNNNEQENFTTFIPVLLTSATFSVGITGPGGAQQALCSFLFV